MNPWRKFPLLRLLVPFAAGILLAAWMPRGIPFSPWIVLLPLSASWTTAFWLNRRVSYGLRWLPGLILCLCTTCLAFSIAMHRLRASFPDGKEKPAEGSICLAKVISPPALREKTVKVIAKLIFSGHDGKYICDGRKVLLYIKTDVKSRMLLYGDQILICGDLKEPGPPANPGGYDPSKSCFLKGISLTGYIPAGRWMKVERQRAFSVTSFALDVRDSFLRIFRESGLSGREFAVSAALLFGYTDEIDNGLYKDFSATGTIHILSVSGMHVGVIFIFLENILGFMSRFRHGTRIRSGLIIIFIWFYSLLTGLSPAVLRAAAMLTFIILGKNLKRNPDIFNIIASSAVILLAIDPLLILDIGFQLSYLAVAGIVIFYKPIYDLYVTSRWLPDKIWSLISVSIAAQLATFPLSLFYFHRFPNYFMAANIIAVPLSTMIIYAAIVLLVFSSVPILSLILAKALGWLVMILNGTVHFMGTLPGAVATGIFITMTETILIYALILAIFLYLAKKRKTWLFISLSLCICFAASLLVSAIRNTYRTEMIVYNAGKSGMTDFICGRESILVRSGRGGDDPYFSETLLQNHESMRIDNCFRMSVFPGQDKDSEFIRNGTFYKRGSFIGFGDERVVIIDRKLPHGMRSSVRVDFIIISGNPKTKLSDIRKIFPNGVIIADASNSSYRINEWKKEALMMNTRFYIVKDSGAFIKHF